MTFTSTTRRTLLGALTAGLVLAGAAGPASAAPTGNEELSPTDEAPQRGRLAERATTGGASTSSKKTTSGAADHPKHDPIEAAIDAYQRVYPELDRERAVEAATGQEDRKELYEAVLADDLDQFGGAWFDAPTGVFHVAVTSRGLAGKVREQADANGLVVKVHTVEHSFGDLDARARTLRRGDGGIGKAAAGRVGVDVTTNQVVAQVAPRQRAALARTVDADVRVEAARTDVELDVCNNRSDCNDSVRAGSILWRGSVGNDWCSVGVTGRSTATNYRYVFTAGHCSNGNGVTWGTGSGTVGTMAFSANSGDLDAGAVRVTNWPYTWQAGGDIWMQGAANRRVDMDSVAPSQSWIWVGDTVCLAANYTSPSAWGNRCGVVGANADAAAGGKTRVDGVDACGGDSGGGWYWLTSGGSRYGYGIHSSSNFGCNGSLGGDTSWFTSLPRVKTWFPAISFETQ